MAGRIRWWLAGAAVALASGAVLWAQRPTPVRTFTLAERPVQTSVVATGRVAPARETTLASTLTGRVVATPVAEGTAVRAATVLVALEADEWQAALAQAEALAADLRRATGLMADSWQAANGQLVTALRSQSASSLMIRAFVTVAVALGIASVLVVSVVQRQREIGILRAMGTPRHRILGVFLLQGGIVGLGGSLLGAGLGGALAVGFTRIARNADGSPLFPIVLGAELFVSTAVLATAVGVLAAWLPALRASRLDPLKAIRG